MSLEVRTDNFHYDCVGPTIWAFGYEIAWLWEGWTVNGERKRGRHLFIDNHSGRCWHWTKRFGRYTSLPDGRYVNGWVKA